MKIFRLQYSFLFFPFWPRSAFFLGGGEIYADHDPDRSKHADQCGSGSEKLLKIKYIRCMIYVYINIHIFFFLSVQGNEQPPNLDRINSTEKEMFEKKVKDIP